MTQTAACCTSMLSVCKHSWSDILATRKFHATNVSGTKWCTLVIRKVDRELPTLPAELKGKCRSKFYPLAELFWVLSIHLSKVPLLFKFQQERGCKKAASRVFLLDLSVVPSHGGIHEQSLSLLICNDLGADPRSCWCVLSQANIVAGESL